MTAPLRSAARGRRSLVALAAAGAVIATTYLAPVATAVTTTDSDGTVTVTADPGTPTTPVETTTAPATSGDPTATTGTTTGTTTTTKPSACTTATPAAPWRLVASRDLADPTAATVEWAGVACATRYNVSVFVDGRDSVDVVPAPATTYALSSLDPAKTYRIQVSSRNDAGQGASSSIYYLRPATPGGVSSMKVTYSDVKGAVLSWKAPIDRAPVKYLLKVKRVADQKLVTDEEIPGDVTQYALADLDARGMFVIVLQPVNKAGDGPKSRLVIGDENPNPVKSVGAIRDPGNSKQVIVSWLPSDNTLKGTVIGYEVGFGHARADERIVVKDTDSEVTVPGDKSVVVIVRVLTDRGKSRWSKSVRVPMTDAVKTKTTDQRIDLVDQDGVISVAATQAVASNNRLVVKVLPTANNGGFTETQYSQNGAQVMTFRKVPEGSYVVTVENESREMARRYINVGNVGKMYAPDWKLYFGKATIEGDKVDMWNGSETRIFSTRAFPSQDMVLASKAQLRSGMGYGVWFRTSGMETNQVTGLSFQYDPKYGNQFIVRQWNKGTECSNPIAKTPFPSGMTINGQHDIVVAAQGNSLYATIDGVRLFDVPDLATAIANNSCKYPAPTGTAVGLRTWGASTSAVFTNTTVR
jgi:hypothetical protein